VPVTLGPLQALVDDPRTTDVLLCGPTSVWVDRGAGLEPSPVRFDDEEAVQALAVRLACLAGRRLDRASPWVDVPLPGGVRMHAVLPPVAVDGTCLSLRVVRPRGLVLDQLVDDPLQRERLRALVRGRLSFAVTGGTGSGKTTLLQALLGEADPLDRVILVEDCTELHPALPHVVRLQARAANAEGAGAVSLRDLVRQAMRMRPDRLVVGEVRGPEVADLLLALNTGHEGGATTLHANGVAEVLPRLQALGALAGITAAAVHAQVLAGLHVVVHLRRRGNRREVAGLGVLAPGPLDPVVLAVPGPGDARLRELLGARGFPWPG
jgi:pilus assembly protein CpaF